MLTCVIIDQDLTGKAEDSKSIINPLPGPNRVLSLIFWSMSTEPAIQVPATVGEMGHRQEADPTLRDFLQPLLEHMEARSP